MYIYAGAHLRARGPPLAFSDGLLCLIAAYCALLRLSIATRPHGHGPAGVWPQRTSARSLPCAGKRAGALARAPDLTAGARAESTLTWQARARRARGARTCAAIGFRKRAGPVRAGSGRFGPGRDRCGTVDSPQIAPAGPCRDGRGIGAPPPPLTGQTRID